MSTSAGQSTTAVRAAVSPGWLRSPTFDLNLILTVALLALASGVVSLLEPSLFAWVLVLDVWLLGYHHVVSTFTRLVFDAESFRQYRFLVIQLPIIVLACTVGAVWTLGAWVLPTVYLYWQWFHYTRQSYGFERIYRRKADKAAWIDDYLSTRTLYVLPLLGILYRSWQQPGDFLGMNAKFIPVPTWLLLTVAAVTVVGFAVWIGQQLLAAWQGRLALAHTLYMVSHHAIFLTGYILIDDITTGWLVLNVWHNAQYILLVWWYNNNRFKKGVDPQHKFLSTISQTRNMVAYFGICVAISTVAYFLLHETTSPMSNYAAVPITLVALMVINFHHYIVDGIIWRTRKRPELKKTMELNS